MKLLFLFLALVMGLATFIGTAFAQSGSSVNVTTATACPVSPLEANQIYQGQAINAAVQLPPGGALFGLQWELVSHGNVVAYGPFTDVCTDPTTGAELATTGIDSTTLPVGNNGESYTLSVTYLSGKSFGSDHFRLLP